MKLRLLLITICLFLMGNAFAQKPPSTEDEIEKAYQKRIKKERINGVYIPKDITDCFIQLNGLIDDKSKAKFRIMKENELTKLGYLGVWIINNWGFYRGSRLSHYLKEMGIHHPEDMSHFIILMYHRNLNKGKLNVKDQIKYYADRQAKLEEERKKKGKVLHEEKRIRPKNDE